MARMTVKIELIENSDGSIKSRIAVGVDTLENFGVQANHALLDHMIRKIDEAMAKAKENLKTQCKLQK